MRFKFSNKRVQVNEKFPEGHKDNETIIISPYSHSVILDLKEKIKVQSNEIMKLEASSAKAMESIQTFHSEQKKLFDEFVLLRQRYDEQKVSLINILWNHCSQHHPDLSFIPLMKEESGSFKENDAVVGDYKIAEELGQGKFATVKIAYKNDNHNESFALKIIKKEKITTVSALKRISNEIDILGSLRSPYIIALDATIHTKEHLYLVTQKGGFDLFEFFDENPEGLCYYLNAIY